MAYLKAIQCDAVGCRGPVAWELTGVDDKHLGWYCHDHSEGAYRARNDYEYRMFLEGKPIQRKHGVDAAERDGG